MLPIYSDVDINGYLAVDQARLNISASSTLDLPRTWAKVKGGFLTYNEPSSNITLPNGVDTCNILHINAYGANATECGITQIASSHTGHLYYRNGDTTGWWGSSESPKDKAAIWHELIDNNGGQTINGSLTIDWTEFRDKNTGDKISDRCAQLCGVTQLNKTNDTLTDDLNSLYTPHVYVNTKSATITNNDGINSYNYPLNKAGLLTVYNALQYGTTPEWGMDFPGVRGAIQTYMPHDKNIIARRAIVYHENTEVEWQPWHFFTPSTKLADYVEIGTWNGQTYGATMEIGQSCFIFVLVKGENQAFSQSINLRFPIGTTNDVPVYGGRFTGWYARTYGEDWTKNYTQYNNTAIDGEFNVQITSGATHIFMLYLIRVA